MMDILVCGAEMGDWTSAFWNFKVKLRQMVHRVESLDRVEATHVFTFADAVIFHVRSKPHLCSFTMIFEIPQSLMRLKSHGVKRFRIHVVCSQYSFNVVISWRQIRHNIFKMNDSILSNARVKPISEFFVAYSRLAKSINLG